SCHGTGALVDKKLSLEHLMPGVSCEACHGPGATHVVAMRTGSGDGTYIFNPKNVDPDTLSQEFCGACHRSADTVGMMPDLGGISNVRFQPYRISLSRGHNSNDQHFACTACHDPHVELDHATASYDSKCTECHALITPRPSPIATQKEALGRESATAKPCPVRSEDCVACHMPKVEL